jgi:hypothetical protein
MITGIIIGIVGTLLVKRYAPSLLFWVDRRVDELVDAAPYIEVSHNHSNTEKGPSNDDSDD